MGTTIFERRPAPAATVAHALAGTEQSVFWLDGLDRPDHPRLNGEIVADLVIVGGGYTGLWTALLAKERDPERRVVVIEAERIGWAASGRNGGFCEASITHGHDNGVSRWPKEIEVLERLGMENLDEIEASVKRYGMRADFERTGVMRVAVEPHQVDWLRGKEGFLDQDAVQAEVHSDAYLAGAWDRRSNALIHPGKLAAELARVVAGLGVEIFEHSPVIELESGAMPAVRTEHGRARGRKVVLATNVFPSLLKRNRLMTVPVYDYVLMTEPLSVEQLASIGWRNRQGLSDLANQFHYSRLSADNRILFGGYDAVYHYGRRIRSGYERRPETFAKLASHFFTLYPQLAGLRFTHQWAGAIDTCTRFCAFYGTARDGAIAYTAGFTGLGVGGCRFGANVMLDQLDGLDTERTRLQMVRERPLPFPPEPAAAMGIAATRWSLDHADHHGGRRNLLLRTLDALGLGFDS